MAPSFSENTRVLGKFVMWSFNVKLERFAVSPSGMYVFPRSWPAAFSYCGLIFFSKGVRSQLSGQYLEVWSRLLSLVYKSKVSFYQNPFYYVTLTVSMYTLVTSTDCKPGNSAMAKWVPKVSSGLQVMRKQSNPGSPELKRLIPYHTHFTAANQ